MPAIHLDCGTRDERHADSLAFHQHLKDLGVNHRFAEYPGGHSWGYWEAHLPEALAFQNQHLRYRGF
jgi:enterochelin esterase-like enzyme